jgi:hypothetical protein
MNPGEYITTIVREASVKGAYRVSNSTANNNQSGGLNRPTTGQLFPIGNN